MIYYDVEMLKLLLTGDNETMSRKIRGKNRNISQKIITFDIETTSFLIDKETGARYDYLNDSTWTDARLTPKEKDRIVSKKMRKCYKLSIMYVWQICIEGECFYARTWAEFENFISLLKSFGCTWIIWVHNLGFEFEYIRNRYDWDDTFFTQKHRPIYVITDNVIFRCTYKMTNLSLRDVSDKYNLPHGKLDGNLYNYDLIRTPETPLQPYEMDYIRYDVLVLYEYIAMRRATEKNKKGKPINIWNYPLTTTGEPRQSIKKEIENEHMNTKLKKIVKDGIMSDYEEYLRFKQATKGGYTHCNPWYHNIPVFAQPENDIRIFSRDKTSFYPYVMLTKEYPYSMRPIEDSAIDKCINDGDAVVFHCRFKNLRLKTGGFPYHSVSKGVIEGKHIVDNGKVVYAESVTDIITEIDYKVYCDNYIFDGEPEKFNAIAGIKKRLPLPYLLSILDWYKYKTIYKGDNEKIVLYQNSKGQLNAVFGMSLTDICKVTIYYLNGRWFDDTETEDFDIREFTEEKLHELIAKYDENSNPWTTQLSNLFQWGLYVTAYCRGIIVEHNVSMGTKSVLYNDTDSTKYITWSRAEMDRINAYFDSYHKTVIIPEIEKTIEYINMKIESNTKWNVKHPPVSMNDFAPENKDGERFMIGLMDIEDEYIFFKSIGSKRYLYGEWITNKKTGEKEMFIQPTVAGISKAKMREYLIEPYGKKAIYTPAELRGICDRFNPSTFVDMMHTGKNTHSYHDEYPCEIFLTDYTGHTAPVKVDTGVCITRQSFSMSAFNKYADAIAGKVMIIHDLQPVINDFALMK